MDIKRFGKIYDAIVDNVNTVIHGKDDVVRLSVLALTSGGNILFDDVPGVGKSMLARALSQTMEAQTSRIQCTPDMLPGDITGSAVIDAKTMELAFRPGPVFTNILLVDEVNRATPKTQSALLEAMAEKSVTVDGTTHRLPRPFTVLATQNPIEMAGTFPLPEAQLDRFLFKLTMGYPDRDAEVKVIQGNVRELEVETLGPVVGIKDVQSMIDIAGDVEVPTAVEYYIVDITQATREEPSFLLGAGPRASIALARAARAHAASDGRTHVYPEDVKALLGPVLRHRLVLTPDAQLRGESVDDLLDRVVDRIAPPNIVRSASSNGSAHVPRKRRGPVSAELSA
jgi:MoxR-like ATPase